MDKLYYYIAMAVIYYGYQAYKKYKENEAKQNKSIPAQQKPSAPEFKNLETSKKPLESRPRSLPSIPAKSTRPAPRYIPGKTPPVSLEDLIRQFDKAGQELPPRNVDKYEDNYVEKPVMQVDKYVDEEDIAQEKIKADRREALEMKHREPLKENAFAPYLAETTKESEYVKMLKTPEGAKTAFIMSEIFNRKF
jgi:hypothetical protein